VGIEVGGRLDRNIQHSTPNDGQRGTTPGKGDGWKRDASAKGGIALWPGGASFLEFVCAQRWLQFLKQVVPQDYRLGYYRLYLK